MKYKERYRIERAKEIRRKQILNAIMKNATIIIMCLAMFGTFLGFGCIEGNTKAATVLTIISLLTAVAAATIYDHVWSEEDEDE